MIKEFSCSSFNDNIISDTKSLKYYFGNVDSKLLIDSNIESALKEIIKKTPLPCGIYGRDVFCL